MFQKKQIFKINVLKKLLTDDNNCVSLVPTTRMLALPPFFLNDMKSGILYLLNAMLKKYDRSLGGIVIGYQNIKVLMDENTGIIPIGTSETEVNISVEFFIFQPKIGSYLEGVINKKSNNHIGCLVHRYFNATILKPEDVEYEDWICKDFSVEDHVVFKVKDLDFTTLVPYIEGAVDEKTSVKKVAKTGNFDVDNSMSSDINKSEDEFLFSKNLCEGEFSKGKSFNSNFSDNKKVKSDEEDRILKGNLNISSEEFTSFSNLKKKKKKKEKEKHFLNSDNHSKGEEEKSSNDKEVMCNSFNSESIAEDSLFGKKKKKKKKKHDDPNSSQENLTAVENSVEEKNSIPDFLEVFLQDENSNDFVKKTKIGKVKKKKKKDNESSSEFNKRNLCLPAEEPEDNVFYSTQLEPISEPKKMRVPFCSPIMVDTVSPKKVNKKGAESSNFTARLLNNTSQPQEKEEKKKHKKRKREEREQSEACSAPKKRKTSPRPQEKAAENEINGLDVKSETQNMLEEMYKKLLKEAKEQLNVSDKDTSKLKKKKKASKKREKKATESEALEVKHTVTQVNGAEEKSDIQSILDRLLEKEIKRVNQHLNNADAEKTESNKKNKSDKKEKKALKEKSTGDSSKLKKLMRASDVNGG